MCRISRRMSLLLFHLQAVHHTWKAPEAWRPQRFMPQGEYDSFDEDIRQYMVICWMAMSTKICKCIRRASAAGGKLGLVTFIAFCRAVCAVHSRPEELPGAVLRPVGGASGAGAAGQGEADGNCEHMLLAETSASCCHGEQCADSKSVCILLQRFKFRNVRRDAGERHPLVRGRLSSFLFLAL